MNPQSAAPVRWRDSLGALIAVLAALGLALCLWQIVRLNAMAGGDAATLQRERFAVRLASDTMMLTRSLGHYAGLTHPWHTPAERDAARPAVDRLYAQVGEELKSPEGSELGATREFSEARASWSNLRVSKAYGDSLDYREQSHLQSVLDRMKTASGIMYNQNPAAQALADQVFTSLPRVRFYIQRAHSLADRGIAGNGLSLHDRVRLAQLIDEMRPAVNLTNDDVDGALSTLAKMIPAQNMTFVSARAAAAKFRSIADGYRELIDDGVLLLPRPTVSKGELLSGEVAAHHATIDLFTRLTRALDVSLAYREQLDAVRDGYLFGSVLCSFMLLLGIVLLTARHVARRGRRALLEAQQESARLATELAQHQMEEALRLTEAQFRVIFQGAELGISILDQTGRVVDANNVFRAAFGETTAALLRDREGQFRQLMQGKSDAFEFAYHALALEGREFWADVTLSRVNDEAGRPLFAICMFRDVTELRQSERRLQHDKTHDTLTGLPNRALFEDQLQRQFRESLALHDSFFAVLFVDLDNFKDINESLGHAAGDFVLTQVAGRLRASVNSNDLVARLGSDEFAVLVRSLADILHVEQIARRIRANVARPMTLGSRAFFAGGSIGIAIGPAGYERADDVMRDADIAMQHAKAGSGGYAVFDSKMHAQAERRLRLATDLHLALERGEFRLLYQPIVDLADGHLVGCEALIRWEHPVDGLMLPNDFLPLTEQIGLASPIGTFVLETACRQFARWKSDGAPDDFQLHVNVSASQLLDEEFERTLLGAAAGNGIASEQLIVEITENVVLDAGTRANAVLERVHDLGFKTCIDDFGTGYSSLRYLQQFQVDSIKIDRTFVSGSDGELASEPIVRTLMALAEAYNVRVVAEGVESERQRDVLRSVGCRYAQGFLYAAPLTAEELAAMYPAVLGTGHHAASA